ncbi:MAG: hypothetical protein ACLQGP_07430 [Isosphaeraceae bacterium]
MNSTNRNELPGRKTATRVPGGKLGGPAPAVAADHPPRSRDGTPARSAMPGRTVLNFHVERMTLEGISRADAGRVAAAMRRKIAELSRTTAVLSRASPTRIARFDGGIIVAGSSPEQIGQHIAIQIFKRLTR